MKGDATASGFKSPGSHLGADFACAPSLAASAQASPVGVRPLSLADGVPKSRPPIRPFSSRDGCGRDSARHTAGGVESERAHSRVPTRPARDRALASTDSTPPSRVAVIGVTSHADKSPQGSQTPQRVDGNRGAQSHEVCWPGAASHADLGAAFPPAASPLAATPRTTDQPSSITHLPLSAVSAHDVSQRAPLASAGSSDARTQEGPRSSATWADRGQSIAPTRRRQRSAGVNGVGTAAPVASHSARAGLIEQSTRAQGNGFLVRSMSTRPAGPIPAGITQGEEISC